MDRDFLQKDSTSNAWNNGTRILRVIPVGDLSRPWALLDGPTSMLEGKINDGIIPKEFSLDKKNLRVLRPAGNHVNLDGLREELASVLGLVPSMDRTPFSKLFSAYTSGPSEKSVDCLIEGNRNDLLVNLRSCRWCPNNVNCKSIETEGVKEQAAFKLHCSPEDPDYSILIDFIEQRKFAAKSDIFSSDVDPFKPGFTVGIERVILVMPFDETAVLQPSDNGLMWPQLFYCPPLKRTLSLLEAQILDFLPRDKLNIERAVEKIRFPTGSEICTLLNNICDGKTKNIFIKSFCSHLGIGTNEKNGKWGNVAKILEYTQRNLETCLYDAKVELAAGLSDGGDIAEQVASFLWQLRNEIDSSSGLYDDEPVAEERISSIILSPKSSISLEPEPEGDQNFSKIRFSSRIRQPPEGLILIFDGYRNPFYLAKWDSDSNVERDDECQRRISWFPPFSLHEALSLNAVLRSREASPGGADIIEHLDNLDIFINRFFMIQRAVGKENPKREEIRKKVDYFKDAYHEPQKRKLNPYQCLRELATQEGRKFKDLLSYRSEHRSSESLEIETFTFNFPELDQSKAKRCEFSRVLTLGAGTGDGLNIGNISFRAKLKGVGGSTDSHLAKLVCDALDWRKTSSVDDIISNEGAAGGGLWLSESIDHLARGGDDLAKKLCIAIAKRSRTRDSMRVLFIASPSEMSEIQELIGIIEPEPEYFDEPVKMVCWNQPLACAESSPNYVYVGKFD